MGINLVQSYINSHTQQKKQPAQTPQTVQKPAPHFDIQSQLDNRVFIKPLKAKGRLLNGNIFNAPAIMLKDTLYDIKALKHALKGDANDHELGKLNDVGLKIGGLGIAGYLFTKRPTSMTKGMEFVGLGSFLASMAIWPKLAIQLPAYLIHGVNVQKEYEDSFGRKKPFYQDPQFIPWDLYTEEEIYKIGDRLGVDKNIQNRRELIQEKMKKIAVQNNTLWMLTAGFATPVMSALICNKTEPWLTKYFNERQNKKADYILNNIDKYSKKYQNNSIKNNIDKIIALQKDKPVTPELVETITDTLSEGIDLVTKESLRADVRNLFENKTFNITQNTAQTIADNFKELFSNRGFSEEFISTVVPEQSDITRFFNSKNLLNQNIEKADFAGIVKDLTLSIMKKVQRFNETAPENLREDASYVRDLILNNSKKNHPILSALNNSQSRTFDTTLQAKLRNIANILDGFKARNYVLDEYAIIKTGSAPETVTANYWNAAKKEMLKLFGFTSKDIEKARIDRSVLDTMLRDKIEKIVSNKSSYEKVLDALTKLISELHNDIKPSDMAAIYGGNENSAYEKMVDTVFDNYSTSLSDAGFTNVSKALTGAHPGDNVGTYKNIQKAFVSEKLLGIESSLHRMVNNLIYYRQIAADANSIPALRAHSREAKEELIELCKIITLQGHSSDYATKFYQKRNPHPAEDYGKVEVADGKVKNKYFGKSAEMADIPVDKNFYNDAMRLMYETDIDKDTMQILEKNLMKHKIIRYRTLMLEKIGGEYYFPKPRHLIRSRNNTPSDIKFLLTGMATNDYFFNAIQESFNSNKWLKTFAGFGAGLLGVTVLAQFFFGKMKNPEKAGK